MYRLHQYSSFPLTLLYAPSGTCVCINPIGGDGPRQPLSRGPRNRVTPWRHNGGNYPRDTHRTYVYTLPYVALIGQIIANEKLLQRHWMTFVQGLQRNAHERLVVLCKKQSRVRAKYHITRNMNKTFDYVLLIRIKGSNNLIDKM